MKIYHFKTFTTSYYFPELTPDTQYMYGLYSAYGGKLSQLYWKLFQRHKWIRALNTIEESSLKLPYKQIKQIDGGNSLMAFNMGSPGVEQKISILGFDNLNKLPFFAKFSQKPAAMELTKNEIKVYKALEHTPLVPQLLDYRIDDQYVYLKAEYIKGKRPENKELTSKIVDLCLSLKEFHLTNQKKSGNGLEISLAHGDFCPWNMLVCDKNMKLIDWELAKDRPLGFDLFTYICQVSILFNPEEELLHVIDKHSILVNYYFKACGIVNYLPYLKAFAIEKASYEKNKNNNLLFEKYHQLELLLS